MIFGSNWNKLDPSLLLLNEQPVEYVTQWKYLGCLISAGKNLLFSCRNDLTAFRRSANSVVTSLRRPSEPVLMKLLYSFSIPILTYACEVKYFSCSEMLDCHIAINDSIRRIFSFNRWESVRHLRESLGYRDIYHIFSIRKKRLMYKLASLSNPLRSLLIDV